ncbi:MAG: acyltransferase family protein [Amylibacter sp.]
MSDKKPMIAGIKYRPEIDGLRCIAVLAVVFFHFSVPGFSGGFVGVDIFFVISGFLIGGILWQELTTNGKVSFARFYLRRLRRLAPAFVVMAVITSIFAYYILLPFEFREFGKALISSTVYLSNVLFYRQSGYFDSGADEKVLLHTWSLSVEEQFYIFLPFLILIFAKHHKALHIALAVIATLSLLACIWFTRSSHTATFFLFPFRAWELLIGVLLAIYGQKTQENWRHGPAASWAGLALLLGAIGFVQAGDNFPGTQALFPVAGTALVIWNGRDDNPVNRALSSPVPVFIGLISYSLYIWHWPILTLSQYYFDGYRSGIEAACWLLFAITVATISWWFVERSVRRARNLSGRVLVGSAVVASVGLLSIGSVLYLKDGLPNRFGPIVRTHIDATSDFLQDWSRCYITETGPLGGLEVCPIGPEGQAPEVLVWGDSHLRAFKEGVALAALKHGKAGLLVWNAGCPPLFGLTKRETASTRQEDAQCLVATERLQKAIPQLSGIHTVLLIGRWTYYAEGQGIGNDAHNKITLSDLNGPKNSTDTQRTIFAKAVRDTIAQLSSSFENIYILRQVPEIPQYDSRKIARMMVHGRLKSGSELDKITSISVDDLKLRTYGAEKPFQALQVSGNLEILDSWQQMCGPKGCSAIVDGRALYFDNNHITNTMALSMRSLFDPVFSNTVKD